MHLWTSRRNLEFIDIESARVRQRAERLGAPKPAEALHSHVSVCLPAYVLGVILGPGKLARQEIDHAKPAEILRLILLQTPFSGNLSRSAYASGVKAYAAGVNRSEIVAE